MAILDFVIRNNISPNNKFYYAFKEPIALNASTFGAKIAFYDKGNDLLYHNKSAYAHELHDPAEIAKGMAIMNGQLQNDKYSDYKLLISTWSKQGNMAYLFEYIKMEYKYFHVFINLKEKYQIRIFGGVLRNNVPVALNDSTITKLGFMRSVFDEIEVLRSLELLGLRNEEPLIKDSISTNFFADLLPKNKWYK